VRVFVGRMELVTPATERAVERALASKDQVTLAKYGRFLEPILQTMMKKERNRVKLQQIQQELSTVYSAVVAQNVGSR
jgi:nucleoside-triphosphatase THEP1